MLLAAGCAKKASESQSPDSDGAGVGDDIAALEQQLALREGELRAVGVAPAANAQARDYNVAGDASSDRGAEKAAGSPPASDPVPTGPQPSTQPSEPPSPSPPPGDDEGGRCQRVCEIAAAICSLEDQICSLAPRHRDDPRYQAACDRSAADCQLANEACHACNS
jgi:hypothetical protein